ncbi:UDP-N-acetylglucosamine--N-acetylmuramyl-(pentapeptide) pyrophosphoryl-undecaprenol N-acetylglucosamine transferase [Oscillochloris sp. ZM17-4]|uniref:UDP-N-acetylglucosamine--N-acetylmuramyl- (pentapeptide) pyrophosphoryl-undecaprenol N-acetylglucosamine transferase n=1 Tax=Oscillochloris sp. ZM17-4 TaxID=2866714 RepID=UPI001C734796|nr:UDP-N-acetylglucosamine--N-acetylmuramyl-(pentapeptide) pyrophosphoryl-undecaprenol N-acetylglucosamine transferase [Oscillochloris sp. ZM17-4]MBX0327633.1 UDP-N-acetylglucosamine--N-acetylmuramyl-(pentapeptide) pyrophosphoryl-undecaprenol N-acetylglucosamine transferase [Oscillochloris sp. ZM17-4]
MSAGGPPAASSTIFLSGGGTGGHVYPALSVAAALAAGGEGRRLVYVGSVGGMEEAIVARESDLPFRALPAAALRGRGPAQMARGAATMAAGTLAARRLIRELRPAAILGTGGYVCVPLFLAARLMGVPTMIYLPDVVPGLAVKLLSRIATLTAVNVEDALPYLGFRANERPMTNDQPLRTTAVAHRSSFVVAGYPVRAELFGQDRAACRRAFGLGDGLPVALVYGGSRGARSLNRAVAALLPDLLERCQIIHVCGREGDDAWLREAAGRLGTELRARYVLYPYLESGVGSWGVGGKASQPPAPNPQPPTMTQAFGAADLAVCRSGASTLAELPAAGLPAVLVPYPYVHQDENADYLVRRGAAVKVGDSAMLGDGRPQDGPLAREVIRLLENEHERQRMAKQSRALARPDAARHLAEAISRLATRSAGR